MVGAFIDWLIALLKSVEFWKITAPALVAIGVWYFSERAKLVWEQHKRKEESYKNLISCSRGFYANSNDKDLQDEFIHQVSLSWLYAPDDVIRKAYAFLEGVHVGSTKTENERRDLLRAFVHDVRKDILSRRPLTETSLTEKDFRHLMSR